jgi:hypothetical protein
MSCAREAPPLHRSVHLPWMARLSRAHRALIGCAVAAVVFAGGGMLEWLVTHDYLPQRSLMLAGAVVALALGILVYQLLADIQVRYQAMVVRLQQIAELNHHIRNALQVIAYHNVPELERSTRAIQEVSAAVMRIESVLREVLPTVKS